MRLEFGTVRAQGEILNLETGTVGAELTVAGAIALVVAVLIGYQ